MSKIDWTTSEMMFEAIGYLACPGVVAKIEAMVPADRLEKFKYKYKGLYSDEYPYVVKAGSKYGEQLRLYLNDNDGCPPFLREHLDSKYGIRLNDTSFISHIVRVLGFRITNSPQDSNHIHETVRSIYEGKLEYAAFLKGYNKHDEFIEALKDSVSSDRIITPKFINPPRIKNSIKKRSLKDAESRNSSYTSEQLKSIGWIGEKVIYSLLLIHNKELLESLAIEGTEYTVTWFNEGFEKDDSWEDKSVGEGCDLVVVTDNKSIMIEVKSSKKDGNLFVMTHNEMVAMQEKGSDYYVLKLNWLERILQDNQPEIIVYKDPIETLFKPIQIKEATFYVRR